MRSEATKPFGEAERAQALTRGILNASLDGILTMDADGRIEMANPAVEEMLGYKSGQLPGKSIADLLQVSANESIAEFMRSAQDDAGAVRSEVAGRGRDGSSIPLAISISSVGDEEVTRFVCILRDLREQQSSANDAAARH